MPTPGGGQNQKKMSILLMAKDLTKKAWKSFTTDGGRSIKALKQGFKGLEASVIAFSTAVGVVGVAALRKMANETKALAVNAVETAADFEQLRIQFGFLFGDAAKGKKKLDDLWRVAKELPFTIKEIANGAKRLKIWGVVGEDIEATMTSIADITALSGERMELVTRIIGRAWQQGRFLTRGPGLMIQGLMRTRMGFDATEASVEEFRVALARLMVDPQFGIAGMSKALAKTFIGIRSMISDAITNIELTLAKAGLFDEVKEFAEDIRQWLKSEPVLKRIRLLGRVIADVVKQAKDKFDELVKAGEIDIIMDSWISSIKEVGGIVKSIIENAPEIARIIMNIAESIAIAMGTVAEMFSSVLQEAKATLGAIGILGGKAGELQRISLEINETWQVGIRNLKIMNNVYTKINTKIDNIGDGVNDWLDASNTFERNMRVLNFDTAKYSKEVENIRRLFIDINKTGGPIGRQHAVENVREAVNSFYNLLIKKQSVVNNDLDRQYQSIQDQLAAWQSNFKEVDGFQQLLQRVKLDMAKLKEETQGLFKTKDGDAAEEDSPEKRLDGLEGKVDKIREKMQAAFDIEDFEVLTDEDFKIIGEWSRFFIEEFKTIDEQWAIFMQNLIDKWADTSAEMAHIMAGVANATANVFEDVLFDMIFGELKTWQEYLDGFLRDIAREISRMVARKAAAQLFANQGTIVPKQNFDVGGFVNGPTGFDKVPIMASEGEMFLNKRQQNNLFNMINRGGTSGGGQPIIINNNISAMDGADTYRVLERNSDQLMAVMRKVQINNGQGIG